MVGLPGACFATTESSTAAEVARTPADLVLPEADPYSGPLPWASRDDDEDRVRGHVALEALALGLDGGIDELPDGDGPVGGRLRIGAELTPLFGLAGHLGLARDGAGDDGLDLSLLAGYLELALPLGPLCLTGSAGVASVGFERSEREGRVGLRETTDRVSLSYGASLDVTVGERLALTGGWTRYLDEDGEAPALDALGLGVRFEVR